MPTLTRRRIAACLLLELLLVSGIASGAAAVRCRMDGMARKHCCCPKQAAVAPTHHAAISRVPCCSLEQADLRSAQAPTPAVTERASSDAGSPTILAPALAPPPPWLALVVRAVPTRASAPPGADLVLLKHCFLI